MTVARFGLFFKTVVDGVEVVGTGGSGVIGMENGLQAVFKTENHTVSEILFHTPFGIIEGGVAEASIAPDLHFFAGVKFVGGIMENKSGVQITIVIFTIAWNNGDSPTGAVDKNGVFIISRIASCEAIYKEKDSANCFQVRVEAFCLMRGICGHGLLVN